MHCIIPCRGGIKRIPRKALEMINGITMLQNAIEKAKSVKKIEKIFVSTDDYEFGDLARNCGAFFLPRSKELSDDFIGVDETLGEVVKELIQDNIVGLDEVIMTLFPCTPLLTQNSLNKFCEEFLKNDFSTALIISKYRHPIQRALSRNEKGFMKIDDLEQFEKRTQDLEEKYHDAGQCYLTKASIIIEGKLIDNQPYGFIDNNVLDIDNLDDLEYVRKIMVVE